jgi:hypothetical protein
VNWLRGHTTAVTCTLILQVCRVLLVAGVGFFQKPTIKALI